MSAVVSMSDRRSGVPNAPGHLKGVARAEWQRVARVLAERGDCGPEALAVLETYCVQFARWRASEADIADRGEIIPAPKTGVPMHNPYLAIANKSAELTLRLATALRLTPASTADPSKKRAKGGKADEWPSELLA